MEVFYCLSTGVENGGGFDALMVALMMSANAAREVQGSELKRLSVNAQQRLKALGDLRKADQACMPTLVGIVQLIYHLTTHRMKLNISCVLFFLSASIASATLEQDIARAAAIENSVERLAAYDAVAAKHKLTTQQQVKAHKESNWQIKIETSPIDDSKSVFATVEANETVGRRHRQTRPALMIRYMEGELESFIAVEQFIGSGAIEVTTRFGSQPASTTNWATSSNREAIFYQGSVVDFVKMLELHQTLTVRLTPFGESPITFSFDAHGIEPVKKAINEASSRTHFQLTPAASANKAQSPAITAQSQNPSEPTLIIETETHYWYQMPDGTTKRIEKQP
jgi:type VI secretion system protein VasI